MKIGRVLGMVAAVLMAASARANTVYLVSEDGWLSKLGLDSRQVERIGRTANQYVDIATFNGELYGIGAGRLFEVRQTDGQIRHIGNYALSQPLPFFGATAKGFTISAAGVGYITADEFPSSGLYTIDLSNAATRRIAGLSFDSPRGDVVFGPNGDLLATACVEIGLLRECDDSQADLLYSINPTNGSSSRIGSIRDQNGQIVVGLNALAMVNETLVGVTGRGEIYNINPANANAIHVGTTSPRTLAIGGAALGDQGLPPVARVESHLPALSPTARNLVIVAHGWTGPLDSGVGWVNDMTDAIQLRVDNSWQVIPYRWDEQGLASGGWDDMPHILRNGMNLGWLDGAVIGQHGFDHVTVIVNSAGSGLGAAMMDSIHDLSPNTTTELVYLDPVIPNHSHLATFGDEVTYGVNYFVSDLTTGEQTEQELLLHNVNMDGIKPLIYPPTTHIWPRVWFGNTMTSTNPDTNWQGYGWFMTKPGTAPGEEWPPSDRSMNNGLVRLPNSGATGQPIIVRTDAERDLVFVNGNLIGGAEVNPNLVTLEASGFDKAVASFNVDATQPYNLIEIEIDFGSLRAEGLLTISLNDEEWKIDERHFGDESRIFRLPLMAMATTERQLTLQLDAFGGLVSQAAILKPKLLLMERIHSGGAASLLAGDANMDYVFNQFDIVSVQQAGKYLTGEAATWGEGDWNGAPGGSAGNPPPGDGVFDQKDIVAALQAGVYRTGPYAGVLTAVPEPGSALILMTALFFLGHLRIRQRTG